MKMLSMLNSLLGTEEEKALKKYIDIIVNGGYSGPIGPLDESLTVFMDFKKKFSRGGEVSYNEFFKAHKVYLASIKK